MKTILAALSGALLLAGCASQPRIDAPAPVERARDTAPPSSAPVAQRAPEPTVEVYAYRAPSGAPDAPPPELLRDPSASVGTMDALPSESAAVPAPLPGTVGRRSESRGASAAAPLPAPEVVAYAAPAPPLPELPPAAGALAQQAERQRQAGDYVGAAATLERALRIQPQEAYLWNRLARVRMEQGRYAQAGNFAQRSNALAKDQSALKRDNWGMIAVARRTAGDIAGATEAEEKARGG
jgi:tetratricopeptide (TPR) repeat protein